MESGFSPLRAISPVEEISAYETLWTRYSTPKRIGDVFEAHHHAFPLEVALKLQLQREELQQIRSKLQDIFPFARYTALFRGDPEYPLALKELSHGPEVIYYQGALDILSSKCVSVVGARKATDEGLKRAKKLARLLVENNFTVMSGLAAGIDTAAHNAVIDAKGQTIAVIGTPLSQVYPRSNAKLQTSIASDHLLISQVPFYQTSLQDFRRNRFFFPERNRSMAALSIATIIVEASDTSGSLVQARETLKLGRKLFILNSCFERGLTWPEEFVRRGAVRVIDGKEIFDALRDVLSPNVQ